MTTPVLPTPGKPMDRGLPIPARHHALARSHSGRAVQAIFVPVIEEGGL
jgi:hypothetical protein